MTHPQQASIAGSLQKDTNSAYGDNLEKQIAHKALEKIAYVCKRRMVLQLSQGVVKPFLWDGEWSTREELVKSISLQENSIFRIVVNSKMPYHGYIVRNPINDQFLDAFNKGKLPDHATLVPVMLNKNVVAMILGFCEKELVDEIDLLAWERIADEYASDIIDWSQRDEAA